MDRWLPSANRWIEWDTERAPSLFSRPTFPELYTVEEKLLGQRTPGPDPKTCYDSASLGYDASSVGFVAWKDLKRVTNRSIRKYARYPGERWRSKFPHREALEKTSQRFHLKYVLAVMNSRSALEFLTAHRRSNIHLYPDDWKKLPIPDVPKRQQQPVVRLVDKILVALRDDPDAAVSGFEDQIDTTVHQHYGFD